MPEGEATHVTVTVPADVTAFSSRSGTRIVEPGLVELRLGASSSVIHLTAPIQITGETRVVDHTRELHATVVHSPK
jgi:beta-xylosidase